MTLTGKVHTIKFCLCGFCKKLQKRNSKMSVLRKIYPIGETDPDAQNKEKISTSVNWEQKKRQ
jgi:hypothetical protein